MGSQAKVLSMKMQVLNNYQPNDCIQKFHFIKNDQNIVR